MNETLKQNVVFAGICWRIANRHKPAAIICWQWRFWVAAAVTSLPVQSALTNQNNCRGRFAYRGTAVIAETNKHRINACRCRLIFLFHGGRRLRRYAGNSTVRRHPLRSFNLGTIGNREGGSVALPRLARQENRMRKIVNDYGPVMHLPRIECEASGRRCGSNSRALPSSYGHEIST